MRIKNWEIFGFIVGYHVLLLAMLPFVIEHFSWAAFLVFLGSSIAAGLSITVGYHRLFAHKTYQAHPVFETLCLLASTLALQWSALGWSFDHRKHHAHVDTDSDPYSIKKGFWYAHVFWLFDYKQTIEPKLVEDLINNPRVKFQHDHFLALTLLVNLGLFGISCFFMHPLAAFFFSFLLRVFVVHHSTWFINSLAHTWGSKTYARELTAVDNAILALVTFGEGYHNYHHAFANDYRNGIRWWHFDPTKWIIWTASKVGLTSNLRRVDKIRIQKIMVRKDMKMISELLDSISSDMANELKNQMVQIYKAFENCTAQLTRLKVERRKASNQRKKMIQQEMARLRRELRTIWTDWIEFTHQIANQYDLAHAH